MIYLKGRQTERDKQTLHLLVHSAEVHYSKVWDKDKRAARKAPVLVLVSTSGPGSHGVQNVSTPFASSASILLRQTHTKTHTVLHGGAPTWRSPLHLSKSQLSPYRAESVLAAKSVSLDTIWSSVLLLAARTPRDSVEMVCDLVLPHVFLDTVP